MTQNETLCSHILFICVERIILLYDVSVKFSSWKIISGRFAEHIPLYNAL